MIHSAAMKTKMNAAPKKFRVTRLFIGGTLEGLTHIEITPVEFKVGFVCEKPVGGSPYRITEVSPA